MEKDHGWAAEIVYLGQPISAYENMVRNKESTISYSWNSNMVLFYQEKFFEDYVLTSAWQEVVRAKRPASFSRVARLHMRLWWHAPRARPTSLFIDYVRRLR